MLKGWLVLIIGFAYLAGMFVVATWGEKRAKLRLVERPHAAIYALSLAVYCTSWTYFGSVGGASRNGLDFLAIYIGPILVFALGWRLLQRVVEIAKRHNIASIADFISARYGKSEALGALVAIVATVGVIPYISLQLKAVSASLQAIVLPAAYSPTLSGSASSFDGISLLVAITMGLFAILYGTRHIDTTEHQSGMILAISMESIVKLVAFLAVGLFVTFGMMGGFAALTTALATHPEISGLFSKAPDISRWLTLILLSAFAIILLPRQFHVTVVENNAPSNLRHAAWAFPLYLVLINLFVVPIAIAGLVLLPPGSDGDMFVLSLPSAARNTLFTLIAFVGGLSSATAMVIVELVALSIMISNNLVVPFMLRQRAGTAERAHDIGRVLMLIRRVAIVSVLILAYAYFKMISSSVALAQVGLISFAAVAQFAPAFIGGLIWQRATARGAMAGILAGTFIWVYTLVIPSFADAGWIDRYLVEQGPWGLNLLRPRHIFGLSLDGLTQGVMWSLILNILAYVGFSLTRKPLPIENLQAASFISHDHGLASPAKGFRLWRTTVSVGQLEQTVARYLGEAQARQAFMEFMRERGQSFKPEQEADIRTIRFAENLLARAVGVASSRLVMALLLERHSAHPRGAMQLLDDASAAIQHNRDILQSAIDNVGHGLAVFDSGLSLSSWNANFQKYLRLGPELERVGTPLPVIMRAFLKFTENGPGLAEDRLRKVTLTHELFRENLADTGQVIEVYANPIPDGGYVVTFTDVTASVRAAENLLRSNEDLELRVSQRTAELTKLNAELAEAKGAAEAANQGKTRFIAAASHDILQSLNAARLFTSSLVEKLQDTSEASLARNVDLSLESVEDILAALLDIARLDAGAMKPEITIFRIDELLQSLSTEFSASALGKQLELKTIACGLTVKSDRKLLRRVLQNFISNAIKYTRKGRVLIGCRRHGRKLRIEVHDTGIGIPDSKQKIVFEEFQRLGDEGGKVAGLGLGLSIVARVANILSTEVTLASRPGHGSVFAIEVPISSVMVPKTSNLIARPRMGGIQAAHVLVIDNEVAILEGMAHLLKGWGCEVELAEGVEDALHILDASPVEIDMILADYHLNNDDGISAITALRRRLRKPLPAILITADRSTAVADQALAHDIHLLRKPVKPAALRAAMLHVQARATDPL